MVTVTHHGARLVCAVIQFLRSILKLRTVCENKEGCENSLSFKIPRVPYTESVDLSSSVAALVDIVLTPKASHVPVCQRSI